jgi:hypothetical protein
MRAGLRGAAVKPRTSPSRRGSAPPCSTETPPSLALTMVPMPLDGAFTGTV